VRITKINSKINQTNTKKNPKYNNILPTYTEGVVSVRNSLPNDVGFSSLSSFKRVIRRVDFFRVLIAFNFSVLVY